jgi:hypothetical protein
MHGGNVEMVDSSEICIVYRCLVFVGGQNYSVTSWCIVSQVANERNFKELRD